jgi:hypothetical protein
MNRDQRKRNIEFIKQVRAGKKEPWEGLTATWFLDDDGNYTFRDHVISPDKFDEFKRLVGGTHLVFSPAPNCYPIGTDPDVLIAEREERTLGQKVKDLIHDIFSPESKQVKAETPKEEFFSIPEPLKNVTGSQVGQWDMDQAYLIAGYENLKSIRL